MKKYMMDLAVASSLKLSPKHTLLKLSCPQALPDILPGQFVEVKVDPSDNVLLRRPISVNYVDYELNQLWLLVASVGNGTRWLCNLKEGDRVNCVFPLGNGFTIPSSPSSKVLLVGGGVGVAPLLYYGSVLKKLGITPYFLLGAKSASELLELDYFKQFGPVAITTEDASMGEKGYVTNHSLLKSVHFDFVASCGPKPMMRSVCQYCRQNNIDCEVSLENMMACGLGACLCCVEKTVKGNLRVCQEGPVFNTKMLLW